jgi:hypothetical protein
MWFNASDEHGRNVQHQYRFDRLADGGDHVTMIYRYDCPVVETGIELETSIARPSVPDEVAEHVRLTPRK